MSQKKVKILRTEYYNDRLGKWIGIFDTTNLNNMEDAEFHMKAHIFGNPPTRIIICDRVGVKKIHYEHIQVIKEFQRGEHD